MMRTACKYPQLKGAFEIGQGLPERAGYGQLRHSAGQGDRFDLVQYKPEGISLINDSRSYCHSRFCTEHEACRIILPANGKRVHFNLRFYSGNGRADFEHVRAEHKLVARFKMVRVVFHK